uniref:Large ribosomal subunit protein uL29m n=1 Tax=Eptatretus burgeri TaxID=7764 RepID=A0A8C4WZU9_EPTBU
MNPLDGRGDVVRLTRMVASLSVGSLTPTAAVQRRVTRLWFQDSHKRPRWDPQRFSLHTSVSRLGLEEFFDNDPQNLGKDTVKSGDSWAVELLRQKGSEDLHKLWYILLKERNMLLTLQQEAKRQKLPMISPERLDKVKTSMDGIDQVVEERARALRLLQTGREYGRPAESRVNVFGISHWYKYREYPIPWHLNKRYRKKRFFTPSFVQPFIRLRIEKSIRQKAQRLRLEKQKAKLHAEKFPPREEEATS